MINFVVGIFRKIVIPGRDTVHQKNAEQHHSADQSQTLSVRRQKSSNCQPEQNSYKPEKTETFLLNENINGTDGKTKCLKLLKRSRTKYSEVRYCLSIIV